MRNNKVKFNCDFCKKESSRPFWEYKKTQNHFCSQVCAKKYRVDHIQYPIPGDKKHKLTFLRLEKKPRGTYYICKCECGEETTVSVNKWGVTKSCNNRANHGGSEHPSYKGYFDISMSYWNSLKTGAQTRELEFSITIDEMWNLFNEQDARCALSGVEISLTSTKDKKQTASLDRIDSTKGYTNNNVQWIHKTLNKLKMDMDDNEFREWCDKVANRSGNYPEKLDFTDVLILPQKSTLQSRQEVDLFDNTLSQLLPGTIPIFAANMDGVGTFEMAKELFNHGLITCLHKHYTSTEYIEFFNSLTEQQKHHIFYSIGTSSKDIEKLKQTLKYADVKNICLDVANAYIPKVHDTIETIQSLISSPVLMVGNIATPEPISDFAKQRVQIIKAGIGSGAVCTTRIVSGIGVPQLSCVMDCVQEAKKYNIHICSDGGCATPADVVKAFAAGASGVMLGSMLAGHNEGGGEVKDAVAKFIGYTSANVDKHNYGITVTVYNGRNSTQYAVPIKDAWLFEDMIKKDLHLSANDPLVKRYPELFKITLPENPVIQFYGMSSSTAMDKHNGGVAEYRSSEGRTVELPYRGAVRDTVNYILGGVRSACTYTGSRRLKELSKRTTFVRVNNTHSRIYENVTTKIR